MASRSCCPDGCEDGFDFWGSYTRGHRQVIQLVTVSGPKALRTPARYVQDLAFFKNIYKLLSEKYGCGCLGGGHLHLLPGLGGPSSVDVQQGMSISRRNNFNRWCEIITTHDLTALPKSFWISGRPAVSREYGIPHIRLHAYSYLDPQRGSYVRTTLRVLPGVSPLRLMLLHNGDIPPEALGEEGTLFPLSHIVYDPWNASDGAGRGGEADEPLEELARQCRELPEELQQDIDFAVQDDTISVSIQLPDENLLKIRYRRTPNLIVENVVLEHGRTGEAYDLTRRLAGLAATKRLSRLCGYAMTRIQRRTGTCRPNQRGRDLVVRPQIEGPESNCKRCGRNEVADV
jgi:hypothetical protein